MIPCFFEVQNLLLSQNNYTSSLLHNCVNELSFMHRFVVRRVNILLTSIESIAMLKLCVVY